MKKPTRKTVRDVAVATAIGGGTAAIAAGTYIALYRYYSMQLGVTKYAYLVALMHEKNPEFVTSMMQTANENIEASLKALKITE